MLSHQFLRTFAAVNKEKHRHPNCEPIGHLLKDKRTAAISDFAVDFDAAIDRAGMHDERVGFGSSQARPVQTEEAGVFVEAGKHALALTLMLDTQQVNDVRIANRLIDIVGNAATHLFKDLWHECGGAAQGDFCSELRKGPDVGPSHAAV